MDPRCRSCANPIRAPFLDFFEQPFSNRYLEAAGDAECFNLRLGCCSVCGFVQAVLHPTAAEIRPHVPWTRYNEREQHLPAIADAISKQLGFEGATIVGVAPFDQPLLVQLAARGHATEIIDTLALATSAHRGAGYPYLETVETYLRTQPLALQRGVDVLCCRFLLEHSPDPGKLLAQLAQYLRPGGLLCIEIPDSEKFLRRADYAHPWEEHLCYFTEFSFIRFISNNGFTLETLVRSPDTYEDSLFAVIRPDGNATSPADAAAPGEIELFSAYQQSYARYGQQYRAYLREIRARGKKVAIVGIGHHAIFFLHAFGLEDDIELYIDGNEQKLGRYIPRTRRPIQAMDTLLGEPDLAVCLMCMSPNAERAVQTKLADLSARGVVFGSIYEGGTLPSLRDLSANTLSTT